MKHAEISRSIKNRSWVRVQIPSSGKYLRNAPFSAYVIAMSLLHGNKASASFKSPDEKELKVSVPQGSGGESRCQRARTSDAGSLSARRENRTRFFE